ncbi:hypothetical protein Patl1_11043 [Pistacia atlantica]|uniref:Uncharacterized protein n=1 Tax=Pistacia atlantica TaxID=434234 RepID=A0ACC1A5C6_9ROSI|nr:hypothetical protein Patl1_11043 [Pistacia atlantica]
MSLRRPTKLICAIILVPLLILGLIFLLSWLNLHPHSPKFHIQEFSIPGLGQTNGFANADITFNVTVRNPNRHIWIYYESMHGAIYYKDQRVGVIPILESYDQKPKSTITLKHVLSGNMSIATMNTQRWMQFMNDRVKGRVMFSLRLTSTFKYKKSMWDKKKHTLRANCNVEVGQNGLILPSNKDKKCSLHLS